MLWTFYHEPYFLVLISFYKTNSTRLDGRYALPPTADIDRISAATKKGVLTVTVPKKKTSSTAPWDEEEGARRERKIEVSVGSSK